MFSHSHIWSAIDELAARNKLSASGLAKRSGLDPTTFNKSKRFTADGRPRWPTTESVSKILRATDCCITEFARLVDGHNGSSAANTPLIPLIALTEAAGSGVFDENGQPTGAYWDALAFPGVRDDKVFGLEITGDDMLPVYRDGDVIVVSTSASLRRGDRVVGKTHGGDVMVRVLHRRTARVVELNSLDGSNGPQILPVDDLEWIGRVVWASQ